MKVFWSRRLTKTEDDVQKEDGTGPGPPHCGWGGRLGRGGGAGRQRRRQRISISAERIHFRFRTLELTGFWGGAAASAAARDDIHYLASIPCPVNQPPTQAGYDWRRTLSGCFSDWFTSQHILVGNTKILFLDSWPGSSWCMSWWNQQIDRTWKDRLRILIRN